MSNQSPLPKYSIFQRIRLHMMGISKRCIPTYTTADELFKLHDLARSLKESSTGVEIGSYTGASSVMIGKGMRGGGRLYCVDTWENDGMTEGKRDTFETFKENIKGLEGIVTPLRGRSVDVAASFETPLDFLFIDGDHSYEGVKADVDAWFGKLKSGGIIVMHDTGWAEGVVKVVDEDVMPHLRMPERLPNMFWGWKL